jgi:hypothetical protein
MARNYQEIKTIKIKVVIENGQIMPVDLDLKFRDRVQGELTLPADAVVEEKLRSILTGKIRTEILPRDTLLLAVMYPIRASDSDPSRVVSPDLLYRAYDPRQHGERIYSTDGILVPLIIREPLLLELRGGVKDARLEFCRCEIPALNIEARSVNHAYSLISLAYEPHRISHSGNVFNKIYFLNGQTRTWEKLDELRYVQESMK